MLQGGRRLLSPARLQRLLAPVKEATTGVRQLIGIALAQLILCFPRARYNIRIASFSLDFNELYSDVMSFRFNSTEKNTGNLRAIAMYKTLFNNIIYNKRQ